MCRGNRKRDVTTMVTYSHATTPLSQSECAYLWSRKKSHALRNLNFNEESSQMGPPQIDTLLLILSISFIVHILFLLLYIFYLYSYFYCTYVTFYLLLTTFNFNHFILLTFFTWPHELY